MMNATVQKVAKHSILYSYALSQPFATYVDIYPALENKILMSEEQLTYADQGESVRILQRKLYDQSYYTGEVDGIFGIETENALKNFQQQQNLTKTGQMGEVTVEKLLELEKETYMNNIKELSDSITPGMKSTNVEIVQKALSYFDYYEGNIDGIYGPLTLQALQLAEDEHDLEFVSEVTVQSLEAIYNDVEEEQEAEVTAAKEQTEDPSTEESEAEEVASTQVETYPDNNNIVKHALDYIGTPYEWGGTSPSGFDCSGFLQFVFEEDDQTIPRTVSEIWNFSTPVDQPSVGDIVFFETYKAGPSHAGIYMGDGKFIHAGESRGVEVSDLEQDYWKERYIGANRIQ